MAATITTFTPILKDDYSVGKPSSQLNNSPKALAALKLLNRKKKRKKNGK
jgi:hypothetical protein